MKTETTAPARVAAYALRHADDNLILAQRLGEWAALASDLEEDIALDLVGQARHFYEHAASLDEEGRTADDMAFLRTERQFSNLLLVEQPNGDFGETMARQLLYDDYQLSLYEALRHSTDRTLGGIAAKALKEARYHFRHSSAWVIRLGDGTAESRRRMQAGIDRMWRFTGELFEIDDLTSGLIADGIGADLAASAADWDRSIHAVLTDATLEWPQDPYQRSGGRTGFHTEHLGHMLGEMQWMQRSYPGLEW